MSRKRNRPTKEFYKALHERRRRLLAASPFPFPPLFVVDRVVLSSDEQALLSKGLQFLPRLSSRGHVLREAVDSFIRQVRLHDYFRGKPSRDSSLAFFMKYRRVMASSDWVPPVSTPLCDQLCTALRSLLSSFRPPRVRPNLSPSLQRALSALSGRWDIVAARSDKGNTTVVLPRVKYLQLAFALLDDTDTYERVQELPSTQPLSCSCRPDLGWSTQEG